MNILIVDDQPNVLISLTTTIDWNSIGIDEVYSASSALTAKKIIQEKSIQILLTDIEMPIENGLTLIRWIRHNNYEIECLLITSHTDFAYAKQGIDLGVIDYVVQPAKNENILSAVKNTINKIRSKNNMMKELKVGYFSSYEINNAIRHFLRTWPEPKQSEEFDKIIENKIKRLNNLGFSCSEEDECVLFLTKIDRWYTLPLTELELKKRYEEEIEHIISFANGKSTTFYSDNSHLFTFLIMPSYSDIENYFDILIRRVKENISCSICIYYCHTPLLNLFHSYSYVTDMEYLQHDFESKINKLYISAEHKNLDLVSQNYRSYYKQIEQYIRDNITKPITRQGISKHIHISPDYISHIVRSIAECSCKELITHEKMKYAKKLIETTSDTIGEIAMKCGYDSFAYFSKVYKSVYGVSPSRTRK